MAGCAECSGKGASCSGRIERWRDCSVHCPALSVTCKACGEKTAHWPSIWSAERTGCLGHWPSIWSAERTGCLGHWPSMAFNLECRENRLPWTLAFKLERRENRLPWTLAFKLERRENRLLWTVPSSPRVCSWERLLCVSACSLVIGKDCFVCRHVV